LEAIANHRHLVLLGDPGSGKSTLLNHLTLCLAAHSVEPHEGWLTHMPTWPSQDTDVVPIPVTLRDFARWLLVRSVHRAVPQHLWEFVVVWLQEQDLEVASTPLSRHPQPGASYAAPGRLRRNTDYGATYPHA
jgi:energy-coupling factor transporter ATP-binding protein EcfA2